VSTTTISLDGAQTINEIVALHPETLPVFGAWGIDTCCGGHHPLDEVVRRHHLDGQALRDALALAIGGR
jgi:iron-sulfur cluster repair protein YtfE (RIC family)